VILLKSREVMIVRANAKKTHFKNGPGLYVITEKDIQNVKVEGKVRGAEAIYFEGNPNAVGWEKTEDSSIEYLNEIVTLNAIDQTASGPRFQFGSILAPLAPLKDPVNLMYLLFAGIIGYGLLAGALGWV
jgi:hypothetical protein